MNIRKPTPEANHSHQALFKFRNEKMKKWYEEADTKTKKEVEEYREMFLAEPAHNIVTFFLSQRKNLRAFAPFQKEKPMAAAFLTFPLAKVRPTFLKKNI